MRNRESLRYKMRLDSLFQKIVALPGDLELQAQWARYLCVLAAGFLETSISAIYTQYARDCAAPNVASFVAARLAQFTNPNMEKILQLTRSFNEGWGDALERQSEGEIKNAVDSICNNRNLIAHGRDTGISFTRISSYYHQAVRLVEMIERQCTGE
ncbi:MAG: HEPN domain-containing protein [Anaerolineae bacterium]